MSKYDINKFKHVTVALNTPFAPMAVWMLMR